MFPIWGVSASLEALHFSLIYIVLYTYNELNLVETF